MFIQQSFAHDELSRKFKYYIINMKVNKTCRNADDTMKKMIL